MDSRMRFFPRTPTGIWSNILLVAYILFFVLSEIIVGHKPDYSIILAISFTIVGAFIAAAASATGIISVAKHKEKAVLVYLSTAIGLYCLTGCIISLFGISQFE